MVEESLQRSLGSRSGHRLLGSSCLEPYVDEATSEVAELHGCGCWIIASLQRSIAAPKRHEVVQLRGKPEVARGEGSGDVDPPGADLQVFGDHVAVHPQRVFPSVDP